MLKHVVLLIGAACSIASCATPASVSGMAATPVAARPVPPSLSRAIVVEGVGGGRETNPLWTSQVGNAEFQEALAKSLQARGLYAENTAAARYALSATLVNLAQPTIGADMTVGASIKYTLVERRTRSQVYDRVVDSFHTATVGDAALGVERRRLASVGAIKKNIENFIEDLSRSPPAAAPPPRGARRTGS
jgi:hypothetical protein